MTRKQLEAAIGKRVECKVYPDGFRSAGWWDDYSGVLESVGDVMHPVRLDDGTVRRFTSREIREVLP